MLPRAEVTMHATVCIPKLLARRTCAPCDLLPSLRRVAPIRVRARSSSASSPFKAAGRRKA